MINKLDELQAEILKMQVGLSRDTQLFRIAQLAKEWGISRATLFRYDSPAYREISRVVSKRRNKRTSSKMGCAECGAALKAHPRCPACTILVHTAVIHCIDTRPRKR